MVVNTMSKSPKVKKCVFYRWSKHARIPAEKNEWRNISLFRFAIRLAAATKHDDIVIEEFELK